LDNKIESLRNKYSAIKDNHDDYYNALKETFKNQISELTMAKMKLNSEILQSDVSDNRVSSFLRKIRELPLKIESLNNIDFKQFFSKIIVKDQFNLMMVIGNPDASKIDIRKSTAFNGKVQYLNRKTTMTINFGIIVNK